MTIRISNYSKPTEKRGDLQYYRWRVFIDEPPEQLNKIKSVEYLLHPTFPQPVQVCTNPNNKFALETLGWGEFSILVRVNYKDGSKEDSDYLLRLNKGWPQ